MKWLNKCFNNKNFKFSHLFIILIICIISVFSISFLYVNNNFNSNFKLKIYKFLYVNYQKIFKNNLKARFSKKELDLAIANARNQSWVIEQIKTETLPF